MRTCFRVPANIRKEHLPTAGLRSYPEAVATRYQQFFKVFGDPGNVKCADLGRCTGNRVILCDVKPCLILLFASLHPWTRRIFLLQLLCRLEDSSGEFFQKFPQKNLGYLLVPPTMYVLDRPAWDKPILLQLQKTTDYIRPRMFSIACSLGRDSGGNWEKVELVSLNEID